jgi:adenine-specific DNA-methyltransferase
MISPVRYMGSKKSLAATIADVISTTHTGAVIVDAFAGTCAIGTAVAPRHRVFANDIHAFAEVIARTLLITPGPIPLPSEAWKELREHFDQNKKGLRKATAERIDRESKALARVDTSAGWKELERIAHEDLETEIPMRLDGLRAISSYRKNPSLAPYCLFTSYFSGAYFGTVQAVEIDSIRYAIDQSDPSRRDIYLFALLHALSYCSASPGHFAQFFVPRDRQNTRYIARMRKRSIVAYFNDALLRFSRPSCVSRSSNRVYRSAATEFLDGLREDWPRTKLVIYADPPYSRAQYSRYYHVLETLVLYDYPEATDKGRYRGDRFQTEFSQKAQVVDAMTTFVQTAAATNAPLYLSYPKNGLVYKAGGDILSILSQHYRKARIVASVDLNHSTMGAAPGTPSIQVMEDVYYGEP